MRGIEEQMHKFIASDYGDFNPYHLSDEAIHDLKFWEALLPNYNGIPFEFIVRDTNCISITLFTDASGNPDLGFGAWDTTGDYYSIEWKKTILS